MRNDSTALLKKKSTKKLFCKNIGRHWKVLKSISKHGKRAQFNYIDGVL